MRGATKLGVKMFAPAQFAVCGTYLDSAARHPLTLRAAGAVAEYANFLSRHDQPQGLDDKESLVRSLFARLHNVSLGEVSLVPSTMFAEDMIIRSLGLPDGPGSVVTDALHYSTSLSRYARLAEHDGSATILPIRKCRIDYDELEQALRRGAKLLVISGTSQFNGFAHDLPLLTQMAHRHGAVVYADIIQTAGATPLDLRASGADFAACGTYKWLMGDMGVGFLYARHDVQRRLRPPLFGGHDVKDGASDLFRAATLGASGVEALLVSLPLILEADPSSIEQARQPLLCDLDVRLGEIELEPLTPPDSLTPIRAYRGTRLNQALGEWLAARGVRVKMAVDYLRVSIAAFNTFGDIETLGAALREGLARNVARS